MPFGVSDRNSTDTSSTSLDRYCTAEIEEKSLLKIKAANELMKLKKFPM